MKNRRDFIFMQILIAAAVLLFLIYAGLTADMPR